MKRDVLKLILSIISSLMLTELFMEKVILGFYEFKGFFLGHVLIFYIVFLLTFTLMKFILGIAESSNLNNEDLEKEINEYENKKRSE